MATLKKLTAIPKINFALHKHFEDDEGSRILDVVYIHGLDGDLWKTWAHDAKNTIDYFWPYWLQNDFNQVGVWSLGYDAPLAVFDYSQSLTLEDLAKELSNFLATTEIGKSERGVIFVSHSLGGMMVKKMLFEGMQLEEMRVKQMPVQESSSNPLEYMASRTRGVAFIAVPHFGLKFANSMQFVNRRLPLVYANKVFEDLKIGEENLAPLHAKFEEYADNKRIVRYLFWEGYVTKCPWVLAHHFTSNGLFIDKAGYTEDQPEQPGRKSQILSEESHSSICKPKNKCAKLYPSVKDLTKICLLPVQQVKGLSATNLEQFGHMSLHDGTLESGDKQALDAATKSQNGIHVFHSSANDTDKKTSLIAKWLIEKTEENSDSLNPVKTFAWSFSIQKANKKTEELSTDLFFEKALMFFCDEEMAKNRESGYSKAGKLARLVADQKALLILDGIEALQSDASDRIGRFKSLEITELFRELQNRGSGVCICTTRLSRKDLPAEVGGIRHVEFEIKSDLGPSKLQKSALQIAPWPTASDSGSALVKYIGIGIDGNSEAVGRAPGVDGLQAVVKDIRELCEKGKKEHVEEALNTYKNKINGESNQFLAYQMGAYGTVLEALSCFFSKEWVWIGENEMPTWLLLETSACLRAEGRFVAAKQVLDEVYEMHDRQRMQLLFSSPQDTKPLEKESLFLKIEMAIFFLAHSGLSCARGDVEKSINQLDLVLNALGNLKLSSIGGLASSFKQMKIAIWVAKAAAEFSNGKDDAAKSSFKIWRQFNSPERSFLAQGVFEYCDFLLADADRAGWRMSMVLASKETVDESQSAATTSESVSNLISQAVAAGGQDIWLHDLGLYHLILGRLAFYAHIQSGMDLPSARDESILHLNAAVNCIRSAGILPSLPPALMARARIRLAWKDRNDADWDGAIADLDEAWQIAEHGPMPLYQADILLHRVRLFGIIGMKQSGAKYPWRSSSAEADLLQAIRLIRKHKYGRRRKELKDVRVVRNALRSKPS